MHARHRSVARPRRRAWRWAVGAIGALVLVGVGLFAWDGIHAKAAADELNGAAAAAKRAIANRDVASLSTEVAHVEDAALRFAQATDGPHWWVAAHLPWLSRQAVPLMQAGDSVERIAVDALGPLAGMGDLSALAAPEFVDGRIDPFTLEPYRATLAQAADALNTEVDTLGAVSLDGTVDAIAAPFADLEDQLGEVRDLVQGAHVAAEVLPGMLGGREPRTYLVMVQNNAEPRATGGIAGAVLEVFVDDGRVELGRYTAGGALKDFDGVGGLTADEERIFTARMEVFPQDVNFTPEFPRSASMLTRFWENAGNDPVDGVISLDPVALGEMLSGAAPVQVPPFSITRANLASVMLNESYFAFEEPSEQDEFFARASGALFEALVSGTASTVAGLEAAMEQGRFLAWSADGDEQQLIASTPVGGAFLEHGDRLGIFLNDGSGTKLGWYVDTAVTVTDQVCADGSLAAQLVDVTLTHTFAGVVADLPWYVGRVGLVPDGEFHANVQVYPAYGTGITEFRRDGARSSLNGETLEGRSIASARVELEPGESTTLSYRLDSNANDLLAPSVVLTPGPRDMSLIRLSEPAGGC